MPDLFNRNFSLEEVDDAPGPHSTLEDRPAGGFSTLSDRDAAAARGALLLLGSSALALWLLLKR